jgi:hypothetical protein
MRNMAAFLVLVASAPSRLPPLDLPPSMTPVFKLGFCSPIDQPCAVAEATAQGCLTSLRQRAARPLLQRQRRSIFDVLGSSSRRLSGGS